MYYLCAINVDKTFRLFELFAETGTLLTLSYYLGLLIRLL